MQNLSVALKALLVVAVLAIIVVVYRHNSLSKEREAWNALAAATGQVGSTEALEAARNAAQGTSAAVWADYRLARKLYDQGDRPALERSRQVVDESLRSDSDHELAEELRRLGAAVDSFLALPAPAAMAALPAEPPPAPTEALPDAQTSGTDPPPEELPADTQNEAPPEEP